jgi:hypothetical protein
MALAVGLAAGLVVATGQRTSAQTPSALSPTRFGVVYDVSATRDVRLIANVPYWSDATHSLAIDVYLPPRVPKGERLPVVVFLNTIGDRAGDSLKDWGIYRTWPGTRGVASYNLACGYSRLGRRDDALRALETAVGEGGNVGRGMASDPDLESLRGEPRFEALVARVSSGER